MKLNVLSILLLGFLLLSCIPKVAVRVEKIEEAGIPLPPKHELRGIWLTRFEYTRVSSTFDADSMKQFITATIENAAKANFNAVFFQVRGNGDAYYQSDIEPWGHLLTGELGKNPDWDPLEFAIEKAHYYGMELHAWVNTFPIWRGTELPSDTVRPIPPILLYPEWVVCDSSGTPMPLSDHYVSFSPGIPQVHDYLIGLVSDIVSRYDVDGIHFDYIRYPEGTDENQYSHDSISVALFESVEGNPDGIGWNAWQRDQLTRFVVDMYNALVIQDSTVKMSAAVIGSYHRNNWNAFHAVKQDARRWTDLGKMDFILPMIYWERSHENYGFMELSEEYRSLGAVERYVFPGIGSYKYNRGEEPFVWSETEGQIDELRRSGFNGMCFFASGSLGDHWESLAQDRYQYPSNIPPFPWKDSGRPKSVEITRIERGESTIVLQWNPSESQDVTRYNIYFFGTNNLDTKNPANLWYVTPDTTSIWEISFPENKQGYIAVSALDAAWNESILSPAIFVK